MAGLFDTRRHVKSKDLHGDRQGALQFKKALLLTIIDPIPTLQISIY